MLFLYISFGRNWKSHPLPSSPLAIRESGGIFNSARMIYTEIYHSNILRFINHFNHPGGIDQYHISYYVEHLGGIFQTLMQATSIPPGRAELVFQFRPAGRNWFCFYQIIQIYGIANTIPLNFGVVRIIPPLKINSTLKNQFHPRA